MKPNNQRDKVAGRNIRSIDDLLAEHGTRVDEEGNEHPSNPGAAADSPQVSLGARAATASPRSAAASPTSPGVAVATISPRQAVASPTMHFGPPVYEADGTMDTLSAVFEITYQQHRMLEADGQFRAFLRENFMAVQPTSGGNGGDAVIRQIRARITEVQQAMHQALVRQGDTTGSLPTIRAIAATSELQGGEGSEGLNPEAKSFHPSGG